MRFDLAGAVSTALDAGELGDLLSEEADGADTLRADLLISGFDLFPIHPKLCRRPSVEALRVVADCVSAFGSNRLNDLPHRLLDRSPVLGRFGLRFFDPADVAWRARH